MYNVSIRNKYFEIITFKIIANLFILLKIVYICIYIYIYIYTQVKYIETQWNNIHLDIQILRFLEGLNCIYIFTLKI